MLQNGILLNFTRLATVVVCFSFLCLSVSHPSESCTDSCPSRKPSQTKARRQEKQPESVCLPAIVPDMGLLFMGLNLQPPQYIMHITL